MMRRIDELHLKLPFAGARAWCDIPRAEHLAVGRKHMPTPMRHMGITAAGSQPEHEQPSAGALGLPLPAADANDEHQLHPCRAWLRLSGRRDRLAQPHAGLAPVDHGWTRRSTPRPSKTAVVKYGKPEIFNTDQGRQLGFRESSQHRLLQHAPDGVCFASLPQPSAEAT